MPDTAQKHKENSTLSQYQHTFTQKISRKDAKYAEDCV